MASSLVVRFRLMLQLGFVGLCLDTIQLWYNSYHRIVTTLELILMQQLQCGTVFKLFAYLITCLTTNFMALLYVIAVAHAVIVASLTLTDFVELNQ